MGSKTMAEGMTAYSFGNLRLLNCLFKSFLDGAFVEMMAAGFAGARILGQGVGRKNILPNPSRGDRVVKELA